MKAIDRAILICVVVPAYLKALGPNPSSKTDGTDNGQTTDTPADSLTNFSATFNRLQMSRRILFLLTLLSMVLLALLLLMVILLSGLDEVYKESSAETTLGRAFRRALVAPVSQLFESNADPFTTVGALATVTVALIFADTRLPWPPVLDADPSVGQMEQLVSTYRSKVMLRGASWLLGLAYTLLLITETILIMVNRGTSPSPPAGAYTLLAVILIVLILLSAGYVANISEQGQAITVLRSAHLIAYESTYERLAALPASRKTSYIVALVLFAGLESAGFLRARALPSGTGAVLLVTLFLVVMASLPLIGAAAFVPLAFRLPGFRAAAAAVVVFLLVVSGFAILALLGFFRLEAHDPWILVFVLLVAGITLPPIVCSGAVWRNSTRTAARARLTAARELRLLVEGPQS